MSIFVAIAKYYLRNIDNNFFVAIIILFVSINIRLFVYTFCIGVYEYMCVKLSCLLVIAIFSLLS